MGALEFSLEPDDVRLLLREPGVRRTGRSAAVQLLWHDTPEGVLAETGQLLAEEAGRWRLERLQPDASHFWPPLQPPPVLAEGPSVRALEMPEALNSMTPVAALRGRRSRFAWSADGAGALDITILEGELRGVASERRVCRVAVQGPDAALWQATAAWSHRLRATVPHAGLAAEAMAVARGQAVSPRHLGEPEIVPDQKLSDSMARIIGQLLDVMLHWSGPAAAGATEVPVHQMRVATRRLRSALSIFKPVMPSAEMEALGPALKALAARLGAARDWDVFLSGTGAAMLTAFPADRRIKALLAAARRQRMRAYAALRTDLASPGYRMLTMALGCAASLRPWESAETTTPQDIIHQDTIHQDTGPFAAAVLTRRWRHVRRAGRGMAGLSVPALHELRKDCKRLRYAAEFFRPLFPSKPGQRFIKQLALLQEELGALNDGAAAADLMAQLGRTERSYAGGLVHGFVAAGTAPCRQAIARRWKHFRRQEPFWLG